MSTPTTSSSSSVVDGAPPPRQKGRNVTSAIAGLRVTEVRQMLNEVRKRAKDKTAVAPLVLSSVMETTTTTRNKHGGGGDDDDDARATAAMTCEQFALKFVMGQHLKRYNHYSKLTPPPPPPPPAVPPS